MTNKYLPKLVKPGAYARILLEFLQKNPELKVAGVDFLKNKNFPFLGQTPTSRLSELLALGLVDKVGKRPCLGKKNRSLDVYKINKKGLNYKF
ncbi:hypothetical protein DLH72_01020 [Candidatus Gracilibacteria bacterium]|nr:MAG: hypothetical protein DLH72_01020 [Candidatus Gracilibacteria bacterium]